MAQRKYAVCKPKFEFFSLLTRTSTLFRLRRVFGVYTGVFLANGVYTGVYMSTLRLSAKRISQLYCALLIQIRSRGLQQLIDQLIDSCG